MQGTAAAFAGSYGGIFLEKTGEIRGTLKTAFFSDLLDG